MAEGLYQAGSTVIGRGKQDQAGEHSNCQGSIVTSRGAQ
jgi:hypothetical protein